jgi:ABC-type glycerol-3-phosphate transport system substrate-binding protein
VLNPHLNLRALMAATFLVASLCLGAIALTGCGGTSPGAPASPGEQISPTAVSTTIPLTTPSPAPTPEETTSSITLTVWGPIQFSPGESDSGGQVLLEQYEGFTSSHQDVDVEYVPKAAYGESGVVNFLLEANYAAPSILPDVALVDPFELEPLVREGLAQPLGGLVSEELTDDLYPFARESGTFDGSLVAVQFETDIEHIIYYTGALEEPPATWADLFAEPISYTFPAAGAGGLVNDTFLIQYMAQGGTLLDEEGRPNLQDSYVQRVLRFYDALHKWEVSPLSVLELGSLEDCWKAYTAGNITVSHISSRQYLASRSLMRDTDFAPVPTEAGIPATMSRGWAFVVVTQSPRRQEAAARLIEWLMSPQNLAQWSKESHHLPTRQSVLPLVGWPSDYTEFLETQLQHAFYRPAGAQFQRIARALQVAVEAVLTEESTPREAAGQVMESLE